MAWFQPDSLEPAWKFELDIFLSTHTKILDIRKASACFLVALWVPSPWTTMTCPLVPIGGLAQRKTRIAVPVVVQFYRENMLIGELAAYFHSVGLPIIICAAASARFAKPRMVS